MGVFRSVRTIVREFLNFGNEEVQQLKQQLEKQRAQLQQLKLVREQRQQQEEKLALLELRRAVQQMQGVEQQRTSQEEAVVDAVGKLSDKMQKIMERDMEAKAAGVMQSIDFQNVLTGERGTGTRSDRDTGRGVTVDNSSIGATTPQKPRKKDAGKDADRKAKKRPPSGYE